MTEEEAVAEGLALTVGVPASGPVGAAPEALAPTAGPPEGAPPGTAEGDEGAGSAGSAFSEGLPFPRPCEGSEAGPANDSPAIRAATDTTPTAPAAMTKRRERG